MTEHRKLEIVLDPHEVLAVIVYRTKGMTTEGDENLDVDIETTLSDGDLASLLTASALSLRGLAADEDKEVAGAPE